MTCSVLLWIIPMFPSEQCSEEMLLFAVVDVFLYASRLNIHVHGMVTWDHDLPEGLS